MSKMLGNGQSQGCLKGLTCGYANTLEVCEHKARTLVGGCHAWKQDGHHNATCKGFANKLDQQAEQMPGCHVQAGMCRI